MEGLRMWSVACPVPNGSILLADPDPDTRALYRQLLSSTGWRLDEADEGRDALAKAFTHRPELLITETRLPLLDGYTLCELLRTDPMTAAIRILVVTADAFPSQALRAYLAGADSVLVKPCPTARLLREINQVGEEGPERRVRTASIKIVIRDPPAANAVLRPAKAPVTEVPAHRGCNTTCPPKPPQLRCPSCGGWLQYQRSHVGEVNQSQTEQWDYFKCLAGCGLFQYHHQCTRSLRLV
jgi:CheY-like chemotaxis protein